MKHRREAGLDNVAQRYFNETLTHTRPLSAHSELQVGRVRQARAVTFTFMAALPSNNFGEAKTG